MSQNDVTVDSLLKSTPTRLSGMLADLAAQYTENAEDGAALVLALLLDILTSLDGKADQIMTDIAALNDSLAKLADTVTRVSGDFSTLKDHVSKLEAGQAPDQKTVDAIKGTVDGLVSKLSEADPIVAAAPAPGAAPPAEASPAAEKTLYSYDGDATQVNHDIWPLAPVKTTDGKALYHYVGDTNPTDKHGDGLNNVWHAYTGPTQPA